MCDFSRLAPAPDEAAYLAGTLILALCLALLPGCTWEQVELEMKLNLQPGDVYYAHMVAEQQMKRGELPYNSHSRLRRRISNAT